MSPSPGTVLCSALASATAWSDAEFALQRSFDPTCGQKRVLLVHETYKQRNFKLHLAVDFLSFFFFFAVDFLTPLSFSVVSRGKEGKLRMRATSQPGVEPGIF